MTNKTKLQKEKINQIRKNAKEALKICEDFDEGKLTYEQFEKRITKQGTQETPGPSSCH